MMIVLLWFIVSSVLAGIVYEKTEDNYNDARIFLSVIWGVFWPVLIFVYLGMIFARRLKKREE